MNLKSEQNLLFRILTAGIGIPLVIGLLIFSWSSFWFFCLVLSLAGLWEFMKINGLGKNYLVLAGVMLPALACWLLLLTQPHPEKIPVWLMATLISGSILASGILLFHSTLEKPLQSYALMALAFVYVFLPFGLFYRMGYDATGNYNFRITLGILLLVWCSDTLAYVFGRLAGKRKLMPSVSPSKTIEGALGGVICTLWLAFALQDTWEIILWDWRIAGLIVGLACPVGDLVESRLKRALDVKDSGGILPGHGGLLDRFDGFLLSIPVLFLYLFLSGRFQSFLLP